MGRGSGEGAARVVEDARAGRMQEPAAIVALALTKPEALVLELRGGLVEVQKGKLVLVRACDLEPAATAATTARRRAQFPAFFGPTSLDDYTGKYTEIY